MTSPARVLALLPPTAIALYASFQGVQAILVPDRIEAIDAAARSATSPALTVICAATGVAGLVAVGAASDATRGRFGRRAPWLAGMAALSLVFAALLSRQNSVAGIALCYGALWFTLNGFQAALLAAAPDRVPARLLEPRLVAVRRHRADRRPRRRQPRGAAAAGARLSRAVLRAGGDDGAVSGVRARGAVRARGRRRGRLAGRGFGALSSFALARFRARLRCSAC